MFTTATTIMIMVFSIIIPLFYVLAAAGLAVKKIKLHEFLIVYLLNSILFMLVRIHELNISG